MSHHRVLRRARLGQVGFGRWVAVAAVGILVASGCRGGSASPSTASPAPTSPGATTPVSTVPAGATTTVARTTPATPTTGAPSRSAVTSGCTTGGLRLSLTDIGAAAGTAYEELVFENAAARPCRMQGYPAVAFVDSADHQIGVALPRGGGAANVVTLAPGGTGVALIDYHDAYVATFAGCEPTEATALRVSPPDQTAWLSVPTSLMVCANPAATGTASISPIAAHVLLNA